MTPQEITDRLGRATKELEYPPLHPELTKEDIIQLLKDARSFINGEYDIDDGTADLKKLASRIQSYIDDIDYATGQIESIIDQF